MSEEEYLMKIRNLIDKCPDIFDGLHDQHRISFMVWLEHNTHVIRAFGKYAVELREGKHREYYSAYTIRERLRWDTMVSETGTIYKISNNITPFVARLLMKMDKRLFGMFRTKSSTG